MRQDDDLKKVVLVGTGFVGMSMAYSILNTGGIDELVLIDVDQEKAIGEAMDISHGLPYSKSSLKVKAGGYDECKDADIVFYGTTNAAKYEDNPTVKKEWLKKGALVISASALLVDTDFLSDKDVKLIADNYEMYDEWGEGQPLPTQKNVSTLLGMGFYDAVREKKISRDSITEIGEILIGEKKGRDRENQIILYAVGGMPIEDVAWGHDVYQNALKKEIGMKLNVWEIPAL